MRLLDVRTLRLTDFPNKASRPPYAILSHVWGVEEVTFRDIQDLPRARKMQGFSKIEGCCRLALANGWFWAWLDTCCIDKDSSAELSEAINSMFEWYMDAAICYAFLADVAAARPDQLRPDERQLRRSRWFTRGWTLQELLAPRRIEFIASDWTRVGTTVTLASLVSSITGIDEDVLTGRRPLTEISVARRMSWAARRQTTRIEDRAYSLMGIFGIYMTTIYGEGENAFVRLQLEILRQIPDHSIFAWGSKETYETMLQRASVSRLDTAARAPRLSVDAASRSLLASSPAAFGTCADIEPVRWPDFLRAVFGNYATDVELERAPSSTFAQTPLGIHASLPLLGWLAPGHYLAVLACQRRDPQGKHALVALPLRGEPASEALSVGWDLMPSSGVRVRGVLLPRPPTSGSPNILPFRPRGKAVDCLKDIVIQSATAHPLYASR